jgi:hypothetical protein
VTSPGCHGPGLQELQSQVSNVTCLEAQHSVRVRRVAAAGGHCDSVQVSNSKYTLAVRPWQAHGHRGRDRDRDSHGHTQLEAESHGVYDQSFLDGHRDSI